MNQDDKIKEQLTEMRFMVYCIVWRNDKYESLVYAYADFNSAQERAEQLCKKEHCTTYIYHLVGGFYITVSPISIPSIIRNENKEQNSGQE